MKTRIWLGAALAATISHVSVPAFSQSQTDINNKILQTLPDNQRGAITAAGLRGVLNAINGARGQPLGIAELGTDGRLLPQQGPSSFSPNTLTLPPADNGSAGAISGMSAQAGGGVYRALSSWFSDRANVLAFPGNDLSDKYAAACASLPATGGTIYIPGRTYTASRGLACDGKAVNVLGDGPGVTVVQFTSAAAGQAGLSSAPGDALRPITIRDISLITTVNQTNLNAAITIRYNSTSSNIFKGPRISNVEIAGLGNNTTYWGKGIDLYNAWGFDIHGVHVRGKDVGGATSYPAANLDAAISITGENGGGCSDGKISSVNAFFVRYVGYVSGDCEGLHWTDNTGVAVDQGITWPNAKGHPGFFISNNHFNTFSTAVAISGAQQGFIANNLLYKWTGSNQDWRGVVLGTYASGGTTYYASDNIVRGNTMFGYAGGGSAGGTSVGIDASGGDGNMLESNHLVRMDYNFDFGNIGTTNTASGNTAVATGSGWQKRVGLNTISRNNTPVQAGNDTWYIPMTGGGSTNVGAWFQKFFLCADNSPVSYTDLTNAEAGRQITIIGQNTNSTFVNNARIRLKGGTNFVTSAGSSLTLTYTGEYWQEIGRSQ
ncbi:hypothetical protein [Methylobacterium sp. yr596]|uniref:hypothetical protein n=1 Tax=Methylobacterium sp. yr596 TaxID=1761800 RepID=UPI0008F0452E|nr:hypothetical protein [Methylobacterium sp. yr596]SFF76601.1 hypothetical protein SAMN04487844_1474 [Methylobacterium sp. yr596]